MSNMDKTFQAYQDDVDAVAKWCNTTYANMFEQYFGNQRELYSRLQSTTQAITDSELESILIDIPLLLFNASEKLASLNLRLEVIKMRMKERMSEYEKDKYGDDSKASQAARKEDVALAFTSDQLLVSACTNVIQRVEHEISFSRELIMGAKKIWDARRRTDNANPVNEVDKPDVLPDYIPNAYIK